MKRIAGTFLLLTSLSGCISFTTMPPEAEKVGQAPAKPAPPAPTTWEVDPGHIKNRSYVDYAAARPLPPPPVQRDPATSSAPPPAAGPRLAPMPSLVPVVATPTNDGSRSAATADRPAAEQAAGFVAPPEPRESSSSGKPPIPLPPVPGETATARAAMPLVRLVNTKRITLNFEVKDVGPSGLAGVELWYTQDCRSWQKYDASPSALAVVEVDEEGMYGFTSVARSGSGLGKEPPAPGDQPQVWVIVDLTRPEVQLTEVTPRFHDKKQELTITWKARDKNLGRQPVSLSYAEKADGPWAIIAANLENEGKYVWQAPPDAPARLLVRAQAVDLAGNVGTAVTPRPVLLDLRMPSVSIVNAEANNGR
jgi:hypothetical protein